MALRKAPRNPFYILSVVAGILFSLTAFAYFVQTLRAMRGATPPPQDRASWNMMHVLDQRGGTILGLELGLLAVSVVGALGMDQIISRRAQAAQPPTGRDTKSDTKLADSRTSSSKTSDRKTDRK